MENVENIRCHTYGCDYFKQKGKNVRFFWSIVIAVVAVLLVLFLIGSSIGCEACFQCAAVCDQNCSLGLEDCGRECDQTTDSCVANDGVTCGNRQGCFACDGKWDCSKCNGIVYHTITVYTQDGKKIETKQYTADELKGIRKIGDTNPENKDTTYFEFLGYYTKKTGGKAWTDANGNVYGEFTKDISLYARYKEKEGAASPYKLTFDTSAYTAGAWESFTRTTTVGSTVTIPSARQWNGYTFKGWFKSGQSTPVIGPDQTSFTFHLYSFGIDPQSTWSDITLTARYEENDYTVTFHYGDGTTDTLQNLKYNDVLQDNWYSYYDRSNSNIDYVFKGWSLTKPASIRDDVETINPTGQYKITKDIDIYEVRRDWLTLRFYYNNGTDGYVECKNQFYEGQSCTFADVLINGTPLNTYMTNAWINPAKEFANRWSVLDANASAQTSISFLDKSVTSFYAKWGNTRYYTISYEDGKGLTNNIAYMKGAAQQYAYNQSMPVWDYKANWGGSESTFIGWKVRLETGEYVTEGPDSTEVLLVPGSNYTFAWYGNITLVAVFA